VFVDPIEIGFLGKLPVKPATQTNAIEQPCPTKLLVFSRTIEESGFRNTL